MSGTGYTTTIWGPEILLPTRYGNVRCTFTGASHAHVSESSGRSVEYRGRHWFVSLDLYADANEGPWGEGLNPGARRGQITEVGSTKKTAPTFRADIVAAITEAVTAYVAEHPDIPITAQRQYLERELEGARKNWQAAQEDADSAAAEVRHLQDTLDAL